MLIQYKVSKRQFNKSQGQHEFISENLNYTTNQQNSSTSLTHSSLNSSTSLTHSSLNSSTSLTHRSLNSSTSLTHSSVNSSTSLTHSSLNASTSLAHSSLNLRQFKINLLVGVGFFCLIILNNTKAMKTKQVWSSP